MRSRPRRGWWKWLVVGVLSAGATAWFLPGYLEDRPIDGGVAAYRAADRHARGHANCACGHRGYFIVRDDVVLWYVSGHDSFQPRGEVTARSEGLITFRGYRRAWHDGDVDLEVTMEETGFGMKVVEADETYDLKRTYLGPDLRKRAMEFDYEAWLEEQKARLSAVNSSEE